MPVKQLSALALNNKIQQKEKLYKELVEIRHYLHAHPEVSEEEFETTKFIREKLMSAICAGDS